MAIRQIPFDTGTIAFTKYNPLSLIYGVGPVSFLPRARTFAEPNSSGKLDDLRFRYNFSHQFNDSWTLTNRFLFRETDTQNYLTATAGFDATNPMLLTRRFVHNGGKNYYYASNLDVTGKFDTFDIEHNVLIGGDYLFEESRVASLLRVVFRGFVDQLSLSDV